MKILTSPLNAAFVFVAATILAAVVAARPHYVGSTAPFVVFNAAFLTLLALALPRPRSVAFSCFAVLLALGFWFKFLVHLAVVYPFVEPIGGFGGDAASWDRVLVMATVAAVATAIPRCVQLCRSRCRAECSAPSGLADVPAWFRRSRVAVWTVTLTSLLMIAVLNHCESIYQIGMNPNLRLPRPLLIAVAWLINLGGALWMAALMQWESRISKFGWAAAWVATVGEALLSSVSAMSRAMFLLRTTPYIFAQASIGRLSLRGTVFAASCLILGFALSISLVTIQRIVTFQDAKKFVDTGAAASRDERARPLQAMVRSKVETFDEYVVNYCLQTLKLAGDRWIGLEGLMAVTSSADCNRYLFWAGLTEDPKRGYDSIYQRLAKSHYKRLATLERFTFLTLPGVAAVCAYGGSPVYVFVGLLFVTTVMMACESVCRRLTGNPYLTTLVALNLAYVVHQMNFPYLTFIFLCELAASIAVIAVLQRSSGRAVPSLQSMRRAPAAVLRTPLPG